MTEPSPKATSTLGAFSNQAFLCYWLAGLATNVGWNIQIVGASWLMTLIGGTPELVALVQTFVSLPILLFSLFAGALADVFGRRLIVLWSQAIVVVVSSALAVAAYAGWMTPWALIGFTFLIGTCRALSLPGWQTYISEIVPRVELPRAVAVNVAGFNIGRSLGPAAGGIIVALWGASAAFGVNVLASLGVLLSALTWKRAERSTPLPPETIPAAIAAGLRYVALSQVQTRILIRAAAFNFSACAMLSLMPLIASDLLQGKAMTYGLIFGAFGLGAVAAAFVGPAFRRNLSREAQAHVGFLLFAASLTLTALSPILTLSMAFVAIGGVAWLLVQSGFSADVQMASPRWVVSRAQAILHSVLFGAVALGSWIWGELAGDLGLSATLMVAAAVLALSSLVGLALPLRDFDAQALEPSQRPAEPCAAIDLRPNSGPILTTVEYRVREADVPAFFELMTMRQRQRSRDGARRWTLSRDLHDPEIWRERFRLPTWTEMARHQSRLTVLGASIEDHLQALHCAAEAPRNHHELIRHSLAAPAAFDVIPH